MSGFLRVTMAVLLVVGLQTALFAQQKLGQLIVGKWQPVDADKVKIVVEFARDGSLLVHIEDKQLKGNYRVLDDSLVEVSLETEGKTVTEKLQVKINGDEMTTVDSKGKKDTFRRVK